MSVFFALAAPARAQDSVAAVPPPPSDTAAAPRRIGPGGALWRSLLVPGWGQARLDRRLTGALFVAWEGVTLGMSVRTYRELKYLRRTNSGRGENKARQHQDWLVLLAFNHLLSGLEAYVSAHLTDFPEDLSLRVVPGAVQASVGIPFRVR